MPYVDSSCQQRPSFSACPYAKFPRSFFGGQNTGNGRLVTLLAPNFDADTVEFFLFKLLGHRKASGKTRFILVTDRSHHAKGVGTFASQIP